MHNTIEVVPTVESDTGVTRYLFEIVRATQPVPMRIFYETTVQPKGKDGLVFDGVLCALIFYAMRTRCNLRLRGAATRDILANLEEFQQAWARWCPQVYRPIEIVVDRIVDRANPGAPGRVIAAFSGGVDSLFTLMRHNLDRSELRPPIDSVMLVHGFDVALDRPRDLEELIERTAAIRELAGVDLQIVRTNSKELRLQRWEDSFAAELAACMHFCTSSPTLGLIGSSEPYDALVLPWGSNPVTDSLLSGARLRVVHDGAGFSRTEKIAELCKYPEAVRAVKVCWEGSAQGRNCGVCEKCVRTQLNFLAAGYEQPACFSAPLDLSLIDTIVLKHSVQIDELRSIVDYAERRGISQRWVHQLRARTRRAGAGNTVKQWFNKVTRTPSVTRARMLGRQLAAPLMGGRH